MENKKSKKKYMLLLLLLLLLGGIGIWAIGGAHSEAPAAMAPQTEIIAAEEPASAPEVLVAQTDAATIDIQSSPVQLSDGPSAPNTDLSAPVAAEQDVIIADAETPLGAAEAVLPSITEVLPPAREYGGNNNNNNNDNGGDTVTPPPATPEDPGTGEAEPPASNSNVEQTYRLAIQLFPSDMGLNARREFMGLNNNNAGNDAMRKYMATTMGGTFLPLDANILSQSQYQKDADLYIQPYFCVDNDGVNAVVLYATKNPDSNGSQRWATNLIYVGEINEAGKLEGIWYEYHHISPANNKPQTYGIAHYNNLTSLEAVRRDILGNLNFKPLGESFDMPVASPAAMMLPITLDMDTTTDAAIAETTASNAGIEAGSPSDSAIENTMPSTPADQDSATGDQQIEEFPADIPQIKSESEDSKADESQIEEPKTEDATSENAATEASNTETQHQAE